MGIEISEKLAQDIHDYIMNTEKDNSIEWSLLAELDEIIQTSKIDLEQYCEDLADRIN